MVKVFPGIAQFSDCANLICTYEEGGGGGSIDIWGVNEWKRKGLQPQVGISGVVNFLQ